MVVLILQAVRKFTQAHLVLVLLELFAVMKLMNTMFLTTVRANYNPEAVLHFTVSVYLMVTLDIVVLSPAEVTV
jgi:hypothetical protein